MMITPGITGRCGKWPVKNGSLKVTFLSARMLSPGRHSSTRSTIRNGKRCGSCRRIALMSIWIGSVIVSHWRVGARAAAGPLEGREALGECAEPLEARDQLAPCSGVLERNAGGEYAGARDRTADHRSSR